MNFLPTQKSKTSSFVVHVQLYFPVIYVHMHNNWWTLTFQGVGKNSTVSLWYGGWQDLHCMIHVLNLYWTTTS